MDPRTGRKFLCLFVHCENVHKKNLPLELGKKCKTTNLAKTQNTSVHTTVHRLSTRPRIHTPTETPRKGEHTPKPIGTSARAQALSFSHKTPHYTTPRRRRGLV
ncbi:unnamed protein product [Ectocarpus sp. 12 AP-2014]